jgi:hypothetical protein
LIFIQDNYKRFVLHRIFKKMLYRVVGLEIADVTYQSVRSFLSQHN